MALQPQAQRDRIFISYRRDDARGASGRVWDWLRIAFGRERVFRDVAGIGAGKWRQKIEQALATTTACVAVIGRRWADATNLPRLQDPQDVVRHELETALAGGDRDELIVIPLLVEDIQLAQIATDALPATLRPLLGDWNVLVLTEQGWDDDIRRLVEAIAAATGLPVNQELQEWLALLSGAQQGLDLARGQEAQEAASRQRGEPVLDGLLQLAAAEAEERPALKQALVALADGETLLAEETFEQELEASRRARETAEAVLASSRRREAEAAAHIASLAVVRGDLGKAIRFYQMALQSDAEALEAALELGYAWLSCGEINQAGAVFVPLIDRCMALGVRLLESRARRAVGEVLALQGDGHGAVAAYQAALSISQELVAADPESKENQRDLAVAQLRLGDGKVALGERGEALAAYQGALAISEALLRHDPDNIQWLRDCSNIQERIGEALLAQGAAAEALEMFQASLLVREARALRDPTQTQWQRDHSVSLEKVGELLLAQGNPAAALSAFQRSLAIREQLAHLDPANTQWQRDLSVSLEKIAGVQLAQGEEGGALASLQSSLEIRQELLSRDPSNTHWQRDGFVSQIKIGDVLLQRGESSAAREAHQAAFELAESLVARDPHNTQWQRDRFVARLKTADGLLEQGDSQAALAHYLGCFTIAESLTTLDPFHVQGQLDLATVCARLGSLEADLHPSQRTQWLAQGREALLTLPIQHSEAMVQEWLAWFTHALEALAEADQPRGS